MTGAGSLISRQLPGWNCRSMVTHQGRGTSELDPQLTSRVRRSIPIRAVGTTSAGLTKGLISFCRKAIFLATLARLQP
jgi:hypothetical protein